MTSDRVGEVQDGRALDIGHSLQGPQQGIIGDGSMPKLSIDTIGLADHR